MPMVDVDVKQLIFLVVLIAIVSVPTILAILTKKRMGITKKRRIKNDAFMLLHDTNNGYSQDMESKEMPAKGYK